MLNHQRVLDEVFEQYNATEITEGNIKKIHRELMKNPDQWADSVHYNPGSFKILENLTVRPSGKVHTYAQPDEVKNYSWQNL